MILVRIKKLLGGFVFPQTDSTKLKEDNRGVNVWSEKEMRNSKHIAIKRNLVKENVENGVVFLSQCATEKMVADISTKRLTRVAFERLRTALGLRQMGSERRERVEREVELQ